MTIKGIVKNWYRELFWMGVGAAVTAVAIKTVKHIRTAKAKAERENHIHEMTHEWKRPEYETAEELEVEGPDVVDDHDIPGERGASYNNGELLRRIDEAEFRYLATGPDVESRFDIIVARVENHQFFKWAENPNLFSSEDAEDIEELLGPELTQQFLSRKDEGIHPTEYYAIHGDSAMISIRWVDCTGSHEEEDYET